MDTPITHWHINCFKDFCYRHLEEICPEAGSSTFICVYGPGDNGFLVGTQDGLVIFVHIYGADTVEHGHYSSYRRTHRKMVIQQCRKALQGVISAPLENSPVRQGYFEPEMIGTSVTLDPTFSIEEATAKKLILRNTNPTFVWSCYCGHFPDSGGWVLFDNHNYRSYPEPFSLAAHGARDARWFFMGHRDSNYRKVMLGKCSISPCYQPKV